MGNRFKTISFAILLILGSVLLFFPNVLNQREYFTFSGKERMTGSNILEKGEKTLNLRITEFYDRNALIRYFLGDHYREMWSQPVSLPVFDGHMDSLFFTPTKIGGGQQTTSIKLNDQFGRNFSLRSVDKDQSRALPIYLQRTGIRTLFRDQASAINPFASPVAMKLADAAGIPHTSARIVVIPEQNNFPDSLHVLLTNRAMLLEVEPDETWTGMAELDHAVEVIESDDLFERIGKDLRPDSLEFGYCRLFDILIGDWDRHGGQWMWAVDSSSIAHPIPVDRDMTFYQFNDGLINRLAVRVNPKFQSFEPSFQDLSGYTVNGEELDRKILANISQQQWDSLAYELKSRLTPKQINKAFREYPDEIAAKYGEKHTEVLKNRLENIEEAGNFLHQEY